MPFEIYCIPTDAVVLLGPCGDNVNSEIVLTFYVMNNFGHGTFSYTHIKSVDECAFALFASLPANVCIEFCFRKCRKHLNAFLLSNIYPTWTYTDLIKNAISYTTLKCYKDMHTYRHTYICTYFRGWRLGFQKHIFGVIKQKKCLEINGMRNLK